MTRIDSDNDDSDWSPYFDVIFVHCLRDCDLIRVNRHFWRMLMRERFYSLIDVDCPLETFEDKLGLYEDYILTKCKTLLEWYPLDAVDFSLPSEWFVERED